MRNKFVKLDEEGNTRKNVIPSECNYLRWRMNVISPGFAGVCYGLFNAFVANNPMFSAS